MTHSPVLIESRNAQERRQKEREESGSNPPLYPSWQAYLRKHQPRTLIVWGANDEIFPAAGAHPYKKDLENLEFYLLDTGHFAIEEDGDVIAQQIRSFLTSKSPKKRRRSARKD